MVLDAGFSADLDGRIPLIALTGLALIFGSLLWAMIDFWPGEPFQFSPDVLAEPVVNLVFGMSTHLLKW